MIYSTILVPSINHTKIGAWVDSKLSGMNLMLFYIITLIAIQGLQLNLLHCVYDRMGVDEGNLHIIDVDVILENCHIQRIVLTTEETMVTVETIDTDLI